MSSIDADPTEKFLRLIIKINIFKIVHNFPFQSWVTVTHYTSGHGYDQCRHCN